MSRMFFRIFQSLYSWIALVAIVVIVITANSFYVISTLDKLAEIEARLFNINRVTNAISTLHVAILRAESGKRGYLLTRDEIYLNDYTATLNQLNAMIEEVELSIVVSDIPDQRLQIERLLDLSRAKLNQLIQTVELARSGRINDALAIVRTGQGLVLYDEFEKTYLQVATAVRSMQQRHLTNLMQLRKDSVNTLLISAISTGLLIIAIFILLKMNVRENSRHQRELEEHNEELEEKIDLRTRELQVYSDELSRSNRELEDFAFVASHDLQEPLRKIRAFGNRLDSGYSNVFDERGRDYLRRMLNAAERMSMLISDLLAFSRVATRGKNFETVDLNEVCDAVISDLEIAIEEANATINRDRLPIVQADKSQIEQLLLNLLSNALKFRRDSVSAVVNIRCTEPAKEELEYVHESSEYDWVKITIEDNGIGFDQSFAEKIFAPFQRLHGRSAYKGTGIGLAVCRRIVERHNGHISALSQPDKGAKFAIIIPTNAEPFANTATEGVVNNVS